MSSEFVPDPRWIVSERADGRNVNAWHWEERSVLSEAKERLSRLVAGHVAHSSGDGRLRLLELQKLDGDCHLHSRKGKKFYTFDMSLRVAWEAELPDGGEAKRVRGTISMDEVCHDEDDWSSTVAVTEGTGEARARMELLAKVYGVTSVKNAVRMLVDELKQATKIVQQQPQQQPERVFVAPNAPVAPISSAAAPAAPSTVAAAAAAGTSASAASASSSAAPSTGVTVTMEEKFGCAPSDLFETLLDAGRLAAFTQAPAKVERTPGGRIELLGGAITGEIVSLVPNKEIVQKWRMNDWPADVKSLLTITLSEASGNKTVLKLVQSGVPASEASRTENGWRSLFWQRIKVMFGYGV